MTLTEFGNECAKRTIDPAIAMESEAVLWAIEDRDWERLLKILDTGF